MTIMTLTGSKLRRRRKTITPSLQTRGNRQKIQFIMVCSACFDHMADLRFPPFTDPSSFPNPYIAYL